MDASVIVAVLALVSSLGGIVVANRYTARTARDAQKQAAEIEEKKLDAASWKQSIDNWKDDVQQLRAARNEDRVQYENELSKMKSQLEAMDEELKMINRSRAFDRAQIDAMVAWSRVVIAMMRSADIPFPPAPPGVADSLPPGRAGFPPIQ
jgi:hypothetical protein